MKNKNLGFNKEQLLVMSTTGTTGTIINTAKNEFNVNPEGGFKHFGYVSGDFIILKGSVPGTYRRLIKLRSQVRNVPSKITKPNILEVVV